LRDLLLSAFLSIIVACGIYFLISLVRNKKITTYLMTAAIIVLYVCFISSFLYQYYYRYPIYGAEAWYRSNRELAVSIKQNLTKYDEVVLVNGANIFTAQYGIFTGTDPKQIQKNWNSFPKKIDNLTIIDNCFSSEELNRQISSRRKILYIAPPSCNADLPQEFTITDFGQPQKVIWQAYGL
jgi:hypothetical protein